MKQIIENGPHFRIEMDILYLPDDIEKAGRELDGLFTKEQHVQEVKETYENCFFAERLKEIETALAQFKTMINNEEKAE